MALATAPRPKAVMTLAFVVEEGRHERRRCGAEPGMPVRFVARRTRKGTAPRIAVLRPPGITIGLAPPEVSSMLARILEDHEPYDGYVSRFETRDERPTPVIVVRLDPGEDEESTSRPEWRGAEDPWVDLAIIVSFFDIIGVFVALVLGLAQAIRWVMRLPWAQGGDDTAASERNRVCGDEEAKTREAKRAQGKLVALGVLLSILLLIWLAITGG